VAITLCGLLLLSGDDRGGVAELAILFALGLVGVAATTVPGSATSIRFATLVEGALWATGVLLGIDHPDPLLPYLIAPALAGGLALGLEGVAAPIGIASVAVLAGAPSLGRGADVARLAVQTGEWIGIALVVGLLAAWVHRLLREPRTTYSEAYDLLSQLRNVTRTLPMGLDPAAVADQLLRMLQERFDGVNSGAVFTRSSGNLPALRAVSGADRAGWRVDLSEDSVFSEAWAGQVPVVGEDARTKGALVVLPLVVAQRTVAVVVLELSGARPPSSLLAALAKDLADAALRLESAMLFDELRELATVEERRRLAREIHDGIAQDLAAFGYVLDGLVSDARKIGVPADVTNSLAMVREQLGGLVSELRSSIFTLRHEVDQHGGLGAALTEYVRSVGTGSSLTVHLTLDERPERLPLDAEAELLRIAQEAVTNARKHANAANLWVRCSIHPPGALLVVEDDGVGPGEQRDGSFGIDIMRERAERLRATLEITRRAPQGTVVTCTLRPPV
jgi:signal transduction histidine kinase